MDFLNVVPGILSGYVEHAWQEVGLYKCTDKVVATIEATEATTSVKVSDQVQYIACNYLDFSNLYYHAIYMLRCG